MWSSSSRRVSAAWPVFPDTSFSLSLFCSWVLVTYQTGPYPGNFALARYNPDGSLDTTFDTDGKLTTDVTGGNDLASAVLLQPDGKIVVAGFGNGDFGLTRYWP